jgi:hypothetical protein
MRRPRLADRLTGAQFTNRLQIPQTLEINLWYNIYSKTKRGKSK